MIPDVMLLNVKFCYGFVKKVFTVKLVFVI